MSTPSGLIFPGNDAGDYNRGQQGVFALNPAMTPKYERHTAKGRDAEFRDTLARMYLSIASVSPTAKKDYLRSLPYDDVIRSLASVLIGSGAGTGGTGFIDFFLDQIQEQWNEKVQITELLSDNYVAYFFGQAPPIFTFSGTLLNSFQDDQRVGMAIAYQNLLRGTKCAQRGTLLRLRYDSVIVSGAVLSLGQVLRAENELAVPFNFQMVVKEYQIALKPTLATTKVMDAFDSGVTLTDIGPSIDDLRVRVSMFVGARGSSGSVAGADTTQVSTEDAKKTAQQNTEDGAAQTPPVNSPTSNFTGPPDPTPTTPATPTT